MRPNTEPGVAMQIKTIIGDLQLGDVVQLYEGPWGTATVRQIKDGVVHIERIYGCSENFSYTGGVIVYMGREEVRYEQDSKNTVTLWERKVLK